MYQKKIEEKQLPTMYDLPSEDPEEPGVPDEFHILQPEILKQTFQPPNYSPEKRFNAIDMYLYYDSNNPTLYKRPDWFAVVGVDRLYNKIDSRSSYVVWDEQVNPIVVVELLSPGTEKEDLGETVREINKPPTKWEVYEQILKIPYYVIYDKYSKKFMVFQLMRGYYEELDITEGIIWMEAIQLYLGLWYGNYDGLTREWLRWFDGSKNLIPLEKEETLAQKQRAEAAEQRAEKLAEQLRALGIDPNE